MSEVLIEAVNLRSNLVMLSDGSTMPITDYIDEDGDFCDPKDAITCVAGEGPYYVIDLREYEGCEEH